MKLNEIANFNGSGWAYGKMSRYACEYGGPEKFVNVVHWNGYESGYQSGHLSGYQSGSKHGTADDWAQCGCRHNGRMCCSVNKRCCKKRKSKQQGKKSAVSAKSQSKRLI